MSEMHEIRLQLNRIEKTLHDLRVHLDARLDRSHERQNKIMATLDETLAAVTEESTKDDSIIALLAGIKQQLADALSGATLPPAVQAKVDAVFAQATQNSAKIQAAIDANTT